MDNSTPHRTPHEKQYNQLANFVPAYAQKRELARVEMPAPIIDLYPQTAGMHQSRQDDSAITNAKATLLVSTAYVVAAGMITAGLLLIVWLFRGLGDGFAAYAFTGLCVWGLCILISLFGNRRQGLHHSASGISHHEIDSRERLAKYSIDTQASLLLAKWKMDHD